ncbi:hypothetical protein [Mycobacteroides abscessus]|uniref:hypothetical protein n=1 Tax=Mycobacteroides abscessus TaxID=36809 RepID=UPI000E68E006|nr:hypothetical protein [Mycobacteroides abscessus]RIR80300.1 hypothetical protein D2E65_00030 [Mycobacteroides abscessus]RIS81416.1 hypothetical protein D2E44_15335 [Mycobacteroides abscessus]
MAPVLAVSPENVRAGANKIADAKSVVAGISAPDASGAIAGLSGMATARALGGVQQGVTDSLKVIGGRYEKMAELIKGAVTAFVIVSATLDPATRAQALSGIVNKSLTSVGDMNSAV